MKALGAITVLVVATAACADSPSSNIAEGGVSAALSSADSAAIVALNDRLQTSARAGYGESWSAEYTADAVSMPPNVAPLLGKAAIDEFNNAPAKWSTFDLTVASVIGRADLAVMSGSYRVAAPAAKDSAGNPTPAVNDEGKYVQVLLKQSDGSWKITRDIWNSNLPAPGPGGPATT